MLVLYARESRAWSSSSVPEALGTASAQDGQARAARGGASSTSRTANRVRVPSRRMDGVSFTPVIISGRAKEGYGGRWAARPVTNHDTYLTIFRLLTESSRVGVVSWAYAGPRVRISVRLTRRPPRTVRAAVVRRARRRRSGGAAA